MGFDYHAARLLLWAHCKGVRFDHTVMIGRQFLTLDGPSLKAALSESKLDSSDETVRRFFDQERGFAEPFLKMLGAREIDSVDVSTYENATIVHDMNRPIPELYARRYQAVIEVGSLEHVFNFPQAIKNCMEMVEVGGHFLGVTPANNFMGHGFYQFSPELFYRVFSESNGFEVERLGIYELYPDSSWYEAKDPAKIGIRVERKSCFSTYLFICARRTAAVSIFATTPQQSDYAVMWDKMTPPTANLHQQITGESRAKQIARRLLPRRMINLVHGVKVANGPFDARMFERTSPLARND